jgi:hypothetical protein
MSPRLSVPLLHKDGRHGTASLVEFRFNDCALELGFRVGFQLRHLRHQQNHLQQGVHTLACECGDSHADGVAAPRFGHEFVLGELLQYAVGVRFGLVDFVDGDDDGHFRVFGVVDGFYGLGHNAVIGGDDQHHDVGDLCAAGAHGGERLVPRRIQKGDEFAVHFGLVRADVLRDAAELALSDARLADVVQQACLCRGQHAP